MAESAAAKKRRQEREAKAKRQAELKAQFGYVQAFIDSPQAKEFATRGGKRVAGSSVAAIFAKAVKEEWSPTRFQAAIRNSGWWQRRDTDQREYDLSVYQDPAVKKQRDADAVTKLQQYATSMGITLSARDLDPSKKDSLAYKAARNAYSDSEYQHAVATLYKAPTGAAEEVGQAGVTANELRKMADDYGIPVTTAKMQGDIQKVLSGDMDVEMFRDHYRELAKAQYGTIAPMLDKMTVRDVLDPYMETAKTELGISDADFAYKRPGTDAGSTIDPKWTRALSPGAGGGLMSQEEWRKTLRSDQQYGWKNTNAARDVAQQFADQIGRAFGGIA